MHFPTTSYIWRGQYNIHFTTPHPTPNGINITTCLIQETDESIISDTENFFPIFQVLRSRAQYSDTSNHINYELVVTDNNRRGQIVKINVDTHYDGFCHAHIGPTSLVQLNEYTA